MYFVFARRITKGGQKRKCEMNVQPHTKDLNVLLITNNDYHMGGIHNNPFHEIYEEFCLHKFPVNPTEHELWEKLKKSDFYVVGGRTTIFP